MMQHIMSDPEILRSIADTNPAIRQMMETNPEIGHILRDPTMMRQAMEMMRNPDLMREQMRNMDRAMANIGLHFHLFSNHSSNLSPLETHPDGFRISCGCILLNHCTMAVWRRSRRKIHRRSNNSKRAQHRAHQRTTSPQSQGTCI